MNDPDRRQTSDGFDHDAMFADIVAHWNDAEAEPTPAPRPTAGDAPGDELAVDKAAGDEAAARGDSGAQKADQPPADHHQFPPDPPEGQPAPGQPSAVPAPRAWRAHEVDDEYEEHFEPPPTAPLPVGDLQFWAIIAGMCGGPLLLLYLVFFDREAGSSWMLTAIAMSVGGFALLISRLPRDHEDGDDDGARL